MIDLDMARTIAANGEPTDIVTVSRRWLTQAVAEILNGREADSKLKAERRPALDITPVAKR